MTIEESVCSAAQPSQERESCVTVLSQPAGASISIRGSVLLGGRSPSTFCSLKPGEKYRLSIEKKGYETRRGILFLPSDSKTPLLGSYLVTNTIESLVIPGWGQISTGETWLGVENLLFCAGAALGAFTAYNHYKDHRDDYRTAFRDYNSALTEAEKRSYALKLEEAAIRTNKSREYLFMSAGIFGWAYLTNVMETLLASLAPGEVKKTGGSITLRIPRKSMSRALARSIFSPGLGQRYYGNYGRGFFFQAAFLGAAYLTADSWRDYRTASAEYDLASRRLQDARSIGEMDDARKEAQRKWGNLRDRERVRNAYLIATASIWALNIIDVINSGRPGNSFGLNLGFYGRGNRPFTGVSIPF